MIFKKRKTNSNYTPKDNLKLYNSLESNLHVLDEQFKDCPDIIKRFLTLSNNKRACVIFVEEIVDKDLIQRDILVPLMRFQEQDLKSKNLHELFPVIQTSTIDKLEQVVASVLKGITVVLIDGLDYAMYFDIKKFEKRTVEEPTTEAIIKGSHEGFVEPLAINLSILRRRVKSSNLKIKMFKVGKRADQDVAVIYVNDIVNYELVKQVQDRITSIEFDYLTGSGYIEQLTADNPYSPFPQYQMTERPDKAVANLMEGRILILLDGTPVSLIVPVNFFQFFQAVDDYNSHWAFGSLLRAIRISAIFIAVFLPAIYIAILTYHYQAVPLGMLVPLAESRSRVPFPPIIEALLMEVTFELLREAGIRLPGKLGPTVGIVGGLVIGQTGIEAGIVSNIMVIVVAITAIATFVVPTYDMGLLLRLSRFGAMILAGTFGIIGVVIFAVFILTHVVSLESLGQPYLQPLIPLKLRDMKDTFIRLPFTQMSKRPEVALPKDKTRGRGPHGKK